MIVLDRIEGERAVLVLGEHSFEIPFAALPHGAREGDVLQFILDESATLAQKGEAGARLARLRTRTKQGPDSMDL